MRPTTIFFYIVESQRGGSKSKKKSDGELFQLAYGGQYERKEMEDAMRTNQTPYRKSKKITLHICICGVNKMYRGGRATSRY
ncbi:hypothetical protein H5410_048093, partial [Solanum commersonii]